MADLEETIRELARKVSIIEENQKALEGAIQAFIVVYGIRRLPDGTGDGRQDVDH